MTRPGDDRALDMLEAALNVFEAHGGGMTPAEQAVFSACMAQACALLDIRAAVRKLTGGDLGQFRGELEEFTAAAGALADEMKRFNDAHES